MEKNPIAMSVNLVKAENCDIPRCYIWQADSDRKKEFTVSIITVKKTQCT